MNDKMPMGYVRIGCIKYPLISVTNSEYLRLKTQWKDTKGIPKYVRLNKLELPDILPEPDSIYKIYIYNKKDKIFDEFTIGEKSG